MKNCFPKILICLLFAPLTGVGSDFLYCGLTETGWQVFHYLESDNKSRQLTTSLGDKRGPRYCPKRKAALYRDSEGCVRMTPLKGSTAQPFEKLIGKSEISDFVPADDGRIFFNRLATGNSQRRFVWSWNEDSEETSLELRKTRGSLRQIRLSPDQTRAVVSYLWRQSEERLLLFDFKNSPIERKTLELTPEFEVAAFPFWLNNEDIVYAKKLQEGNFDLWVCDTITKECKPLITTDDASEFSPSALLDSSLIYFERQFHSRPGMPSIFVFDLNVGSEKELDLGLPAKEPWCFTNVK